MKTIRIEVAAALDQQGNWEEFTWDLFPVVPGERTLHLQTNGLPKIGVHIPAGGILVGKIGKTKSFRRDQLPAPLEIHGLNFAKLSAKFGPMWYDASCYATPENAGVVVDAYFETKNERPVAVVVVNPGLPVSPLPALGTQVGVSQSPEDKFREYLTSRAQRYTELQRDMVKYIFSKHNQFVPDQLIDEMKQEGFQVSRATVYRTLNKLVDAGLLRRLDIGSGLIPIYVIKR